MPDKKELIEELNWVSERVSNRVWTVSAGILATAITFTFEGAASAGEPFLSPKELAVPMAFALLAMAADFIQYLSGYWLAYKSWTEFELSDDGEVKFRTNDWRFRLKGWMFKAKSGFCIIATFSMVAMIGFKML